MHPNFALRRLVDCVRPHDGDIQAVRDRFGEVQIGLARAFPRSRIVPIGSHSRGTAIAVHSHIDFLAVLPSEWAIWGARRISLLKIIHRMTEHLGEFAPGVRRDGRGVELYFNGVTCAVDVMPGFLVRATDRYPVYSVPGEDNQWIEASPRMAQRALLARKRPERRETALDCSAHQNMAVCRLPTFRDLGPVCRYAPGHIGRRGRN